MRHPETSGLPTDLIAIAAGFGAPELVDAASWRTVGEPGASPWIAVRGDGAAVGIAARDGVAAVVLGSGVRRLAGDAASAAAAVVTRWFAGGAQGLTGLGGDLVALVADGRSATLAAYAGPGPHRLAQRGAGAELVLTSSLVVVGSGEPPNRRDEDFLLAHGFIPEGATAYSSVRFVPAGSVLVATAESDAPGVTPVPAAVPEAGEDDPAARGDRLYELLVAAVERQAGGRTEHAVFLGGFDSALVAALLVQLGHRVHTYTFEFPDPQFNQRNVDVVTRALGGEHTWVPITPDVIGAGLAEFAGVYNQPVSQPHYLLHTLTAARRVRDDGFEHVFTGDGCDAVFLGFPTVNRRAQGVDAGRRLPAPVARTLLRVSRPAVFERQLGHVYRLGRSMLEEVTAPATVRGHLPFAIFGDVSRDRLRRGVPAPGAAPIAPVRERLAAGATDLDVARRAFHGHGLTGQSATKVEGAVAATGLTQSSPFTDPAVRAFALALPSDALRRAGAGADAMGKEVLVRMAHERGLLPAIVIDQKKQSPSTSPIDEWYQGPLRAQVLAQLEGLPFAWDRRYVEGLLRPKWAEGQYRRRVSIDQHALRAVGLLMTYAAFTARAA